MKKILSLLIISLLFFQPAWALLDDSNVYSFSTLNSTEAKLTKNVYTNYTGEFVVPETVIYEGTTYTIVEIDKQCFQGSSITSLTIPNTVRTIGSSLFYSSTPVRTITIGSGVTSIDDNAFSQALVSSFTSITVDPNNTTYSDYNGALYDKAQTKLLRAPMSNHTDNFTFPSTVTTIGNSAFFNWQGYDITVPEGVTSLGDMAFYSSMLMRVTLPASLTTIGEGALSSSWLESITIADGNPMYATVNGALYNSDKTTLITFPCRKTTNIDFPATLTTIGTMAFSNTILTAFTIPESVTTIETSAFSDAKFTSISIPDNVTELGESAFYRCTSLQEVTFGNGISTIPNSAFYWCSGLTSVTIPENITTLEMSAFYGCSNLRTVNLGAGVTMIKASCFNDCSILDTIYCSAPAVPTLGSGNPIQNSTLIVPASMIASYYKNSSWNVVKAYKASDCDATIMDRTEYTSPAQDANTYSTLCYFRNFRNTSWTPLYVPFRISQETFKEQGLETAVFTSVNWYGENVYSLKYTRNIPDLNGYIRANTIALIRPNKPEAKTVVVTENNVETLAAAESAQQILQDDNQNPTITLTFNGTYQNHSGGGFYAMRSGVLAEVADESVTLGPQRWYMMISAPTSAPSFRIESEDDLVVDYGTDMLTVDNGDGTIEMFFSLDGRHLEAKDIQNLKPGIYVQNGKKVMVK